MNKPSPKRIRKYSKQDTEIAQLKQKIEYLPRKEEHIYPENMDLASGNWTELPTEITELLVHQPPPCPLFPSPKVMLMQACWRN
jgi:hypothetical protein